MNKLLLLSVSLIACLITAESLGSQPKPAHSSAGNAANSQSNNDSGWAQLKAASLQMLESSNPTLKDLNNNLSALCYFTQIPAEEIDTRNSLITAMRLKMKNPNK